MVTVLDQFEIESLGSYQSGSYDQVVMGNMYSIVKNNGRKSVILGNRGVVYGYFDNDVEPGTTLFDSSNSTSYRSQPFSEKSGASRTAKITCQEERIYDSMPPHAWQCFNINGASVFVCYPEEGTPGYPYIQNGLEYPTVGYIMFDNYVQGGSNNREAINVGVDRHWTKSFPYESRYSSVARQDSLKFLRDDVYATYSINFITDGLFPALPIPSKKVKGAFIGTVGPESIGQYSHSPDLIVPPGSKWKHYWACDVFDTEQIDEFSKGDLTSSMEIIDMSKVIYGFGDVNTKFATDSYPDDILGTHNWPEFRKKFATNPSPPPPPSEIYEYLTASMWCVSPIIRGWKYGLYSGLPSYSSVHFRRGRYGQFRDMLEQRMFTKFFKSPNKQNKYPNTLIESKLISDGPVTVKFVDSNGNLTNPENTQSQNLSFEATSSMPYFDGQQKNRNAGSFNTTNLEMIIFGKNSSGEIII